MASAIAVATFSSAPTTLMLVLFLSMLLPNSATAPSPVPSFNNEETVTLPSVFIFTPSIWDFWLALKIATTVLEAILATPTTMAGAWVKASAVAVPSALTLTVSALRVPLPVSIASAIEAALASARLTPMVA